MRGDIDAINSTRKFEKSWQVANYLRDICIFLKKKNKEKSYFTLSDDSDIRKLARTPPQSLSEAMAVVLRCSCFFTSPNSGRSLPSDPLPGKSQAPGQYYPVHNLLFLLQSFLTFLLPFEILFKFEVILPLCSKFVVPIYLLKL